MSFIVCVLRFDFISIVDQLSFADVEHDAKRKARHFFEYQRRNS